MFHIIQENLFKDIHYDKLIHTIKRMGLGYEVVKVLAASDEIEFKTARKDVFAWGSIKLARIATRYGWQPGSLMNDNHNFMVYKEYYKEHLFNYPSKIYNFQGEYELPSQFFARPTEDNKKFTGTIFIKKDYLALKASHRKDKKQDFQVQITNIKPIQKEFRFWIVGGEVITGSLYRFGDKVHYDSIVDQAALEFCLKMARLYQLAPAFVMDIVQSNDNYYIMECNCINSAGFYQSNLPKLIDALESHFT